MHCVCVLAHKTAWTQAGESYHEIDYRFAQFHIDSASEAKKVMKCFSVANSRTYVHFYREM